jgi:hypothetical protein
VAPIGAQGPAAEAPQNVSPSWQGFPHAGAVGRALLAPPVSVRAVYGGFAGWCRHVTLLLRFAWGPGKYTAAPFQVTLVTVHPRGGRSIYPAVYLCCYEDALGIFTRLLRVVILD